MIRTLLAMLLSSILLLLSVAWGATTAADSLTPETVVTAFQKLPSYELQCQDESQSGAQPVKVGSKFQFFFNKEFYEIFMWAQCAKPNVPPHYMELRDAIDWDVRYGLGQHLFGDKNTPAIKNIRIHPAKYQGTDTATVDVAFDVMTAHTWSVPFTTYTLIREDGQWKINDIAPHGDTPENSEQEPALEHSDSIKTDMLNNYRAAEERYKQEQTGKSSPKK